jgi:hypothetical protein
MMMNTTLEQLRGLKLNGMAAGLHEQLSSTGLHGLSFEERMALLVEREVHWRSDKKRERLMKEARLKYPQSASLPRGTLGRTRAGLPEASTPCTAKTFLARSMPTVTIAMDFPF